ncbi:carbohydrate ABC transporter permease, partial [Cellulosimicrobium funkei]|uniref:carbohydrate ABC transporter permease n=2 Tax=Cellulosimicrobium TaxID=157920 RepID=UPI003F901386
MLKSLRRAGPALLLLAPSLILVGVFVYGLIGANFRTSITDNHTAAQATGQKPSVVVWFENYTALLGSEAFQHSLKNLVLYTVVFLAGTMLMGFLWAWMLDKPVKGEGIFRSVYLFPMAVSFVAS